MSIYFVIDTETYAGNFERELCAYLTGRIGDCGVGQSSATRFDEDLGETEWPDLLEDLVGSESDDHGCSRPCKIYPTPGWFNNGMGGIFREDDLDAEKKALAEHEIEVRRYAEESIRGCYADKNIGNREADRFLKEHLDKPLNRHAAYLSVAIVLNHDPDTKTIDFLKERAQTWDGSPGITGFRLVRTREVVTWVQL